MNFNLSQHSIAKMATAPIKSKTHHAFLPKCPGMSVQWSDQSNNVPDKRAMGFLSMTRVPKEKNLWIRIIIAGKACQFWNWGVSTVCN
jgi:hypothetical protein